MLREILAGQGRPFHVRMRERGALLRRKCQLRAGRSSCKMRGIRAWGVPLALLGIGLSFLAIYAFAAASVARANADGCVIDGNGTADGCSAILASPVPLYLSFTFIIASAVVDILNRRARRRRWQRALFEDPSVPPWAEHRG